MRKRVFTLFFLTAFLCLTTATINAQSGYKYPDAKKIDQVDDYFGTKVADPYRWMENPKAEGMETWIEAQNKFADSYFESIPERTKIKERLTKLWNYEKYSTPFQEGGKYFYFKNDGLQNQSVLYVAESVTDAGRVLLDPNKLSEDGTVALAGTAVSPDGKILAYGISKAGSDWREYRFMDIETQKDLPDVLKDIKFSGVSWTADSKGVFYSRYPTPNESSKLEDANINRKLFYHQIGAKQTKDALVYERPDNPKLGISGFVTEDGSWLVIYLSEGSSGNSQVLYKDLRMKDGPIKPLVDKFDAKYSFVGNIGATFFFVTDKDAVRLRLVAVNLFDSDHSFYDVIPEGEDTLTSVSLINYQLVANYLKDAYTQIKVFDLWGNFIRDVELPGIGSAGGFNGKRYENQTFYTYSSFNSPPTTYRYDMNTGESTVFRKADVDFRSEDYVVKQEFFKSKDGTRIPIFIIHRNDVDLDGTNPTILYGYGGFNISMTPGFSVARLAWMEMGGVYAIANLRGGGEYGKEWHAAGTKLRKQNVFDDFIGAAEHLIERKYTSSKKLAIQGGSNGGLLVGAVLNQRPELFGAALPAVGVMDMLRFQKFTIGWAWTSDYGSSENEQEFKALYAYSPLHNVIKGGNYPPVLVTTSDHDDRVVPAHSFKYAAAMQEAQGGAAPILIRIETKAGHGAGKPTSKQIEQVADTYGFLVKSLGMEIK